MGASTAAAASGKVGGISGRAVVGDIDGDAVTTVTAVASVISILAKVAPLEACSGVSLITDTNLAQLLPRSSSIDVTSRHRLSQA